jgi:hypothetical protein
MSELTREAFRAALDRQGIAPPPKDFEAAFGTAQFLTDCAHRVAEFVEFRDHDPSR